MRTKRKDEIIKILRQSGGVLTQSEILEKIQNQFTSKNSARVVVSMCLKRLESENVVKCKKIVNEKAGGIQANQWSLL